MTPSHDQLAFQPEVIASSSPLVVNQSWSRLYHDLIHRGEIRQIGFTALAVYVVIKGHADRVTGSARLSHHRISAIIGKCERTAMRAVGTLEKSGLISVKRLHRNLNEYQVIERLLVKSPNNQEIVGELVWPSAPTSQSVIDAGIREFRATGRPPPVVKYSRRLRITELEETYELFHSDGAVDN